MTPIPKPTPIVSVTPINYTSHFTPVNKNKNKTKNKNDLLLPRVSIPPEIIDSPSIKMASETETPVAAGPEAMELSTPVKQEQTEMDEIQTPTPTPTPRKRNRPVKGKTTALRAPKTPTKAGTATSKAECHDNDDYDSSASTSPSKKNKPNPSGSGSATKKSMGPIPTSFEMAGVSDRLILRMRDEEGRGWPEINTAWMATTGISVGKTTLRMRYRTMKSNFVEVVGEDEPRLLSAKKEVEERFESEKWTRIAEMIHSSGGKQYPAMALQKKFKVMMSKASANPTTAGSGSAASTAGGDGAGAGAGNAHAGAEADNVEEEED